MIEQLKLARYKLSQDRPYFSAALWALTFIPDAHLEIGGQPTMGVDQYWRCYYHPAIDWPLDQLTGALCHELLHLLRNHAARAAVLGVTAELAMRWNIAADAEINDDLRQEDMALPAWVVYPESLGQEENLLAEEYYLQVPPSLLSRVANVGNGQCGSAATGVSEEYELAAPSQTGQATGVGSEEANLIRQRVAEQILNHAKTQGHISLGLERWANELLHPIVPWQKVLAGTVRHALVRKTGAVDYTYSRPARRQLPQIILPRLYAPAPKVSVIVDTSGSMDQAAIASALGEVLGILRAVGQEIALVSCDSNAVAQKATNVKQVKLYGGGGTDMCAGITMALVSKPDVVIVISDCETPWPQTAPPCQMIVCRVGAGGVVPPYAKEVKCG